MTTIVREVFVLHRTKDKAMHHTKEKGVHDTDSLKQQTHTSNFKKKSDFVLFSHNIARTVRRFPLDILRVLSPKRPASTLKAEKGNSTFSIFEKEVHRNCHSDAQRRASTWREFLFCKDSQLDTGVRFRFAKS